MFFMFNIELYTFLTLRVKNYKLTLSSPAQNISFIKHNESKYRILKFIVALADKLFLECNIRFFLDSDCLR
jgi:hypothetical protein